MLHNSLTVFEWANLWGVEIITEKAYCKVQNGYKIIFYYMTRTLFFWWTKTKRCWSSCPFPYKDSKTSAGYYHFKEVCDAKIIFFVISSLLDIHSIFTCSIIAFRAIDYHSPRVPTRHFHILCKICDHIHRQKLLLTHGVGMICYKTFPNFYIFPCKKYSFCPKLSPCNSPNGKLIPLSQNTEYKKTFRWKQ